jgi:hypothetical protein
VQAFLKTIKEGSKIAFLTDFSIYSVMIIMASLSKVSKLKIFLSSLSAYEGITIYRSRLTDMLKAISIDRGLDMILYSTLLLYP